jgi:carbonic anhydrase/acetyltransferase-like protein (isoleucine patch superfamily)
MMLPYRGKMPRADASVFLAETARVIGDVELGPDASVWFGAVVRGDVNYIRIGARSNIQDLTIIHANEGAQVTVLEDEVTVGHRAILHGCRVLARSLIGMGSVILEDVVVGPESIVGAGAVVSPGTVIPARSLAMGVPARVVRPLREEEIERLRVSAENYVRLKNDYLKGR